MTDDADPQSVATATYFIVDEESGAHLDQPEFPTREAAEQHLRENFAAIMAAGLPLLDADTEELMLRAVEKLERDLHDPSCPMKRVREILAFMRRKGWPARTRDAAIKRRIEALDAAARAADGTPAT